MLNRAGEKHQEWRRLGLDTVKRTAAVVAGDGSPVSRYEAGRPHLPGSLHRLMAPVFAAGLLKCLNIRPQLDRAEDTFEGPLDGLKVDECLRLRYAVYGREVFLQEGRQVRR